MYKSYLFLHVLNIHPFHVHEVGFLTGINPSCPCSEINFRSSAFKTSISRLPRWALSIGVQKSGQPLYNFHRHGQCYTKRLLPPYVFFIRCFKRVCQLPLFYVISYATLKFFWSPREFFSNRQAKARRFTGRSHLMILSMKMAGKLNLGITLRDNWEDKIQPC